MRSRPARAWILTSGRPTRPRIPAFAGAELATTPGSGAGHGLGIRLFLWGLALLGILGLEIRSGVAMDSESYRKQVETLVKTAWGKIDATNPPQKSLGDFVSWRHAISPPIPASWPPNGKGVLYYYAFAYGTSPARLADGQFVGAPWAKVTVDVKGDSPPQLEILRDDIKEVGIQGVRPLATDEIAALKQRPEAEARVMELSKETSLPPGPSESMRSYYSLWCATNGTIAGQLRPHHKDFFTWVGCK